MDLIIAKTLSTIFGFYYRNFSDFFGLSLDLHTLLIISIFSVLLIRYLLLESEFMGKTVGLLTLFVIVIVFIWKLFVFSHNPAIGVFYGILVAVVYAITFPSAYFLYKDPAEPPKKSKFKKDITKYKSNIKVSIVVPVFNEEEFIDKCVESFVEAKYPNKEIIFVNDCSTDDTLKILKIYEKKGLIKVIDLKQNAGKKKAIAAGTKFATGDLFVYSDSDSIIDPLAINYVVYAFDRNKKLGALSGHCRAWNAEESILTRIQDTWYEGQFRIRKSAESAFKSVPCVSGPLAAFRREACFNFLGVWGEDIFLGTEYKGATDRMLTALVLGSHIIGDKVKEKNEDDYFVKTCDFPTQKWEVEYSLLAKVWTVVPPSFRILMKQQFRWKRNFVRMFFFIPKFYWRRGFWPSMIFYLRLLFTTAAPLIVFLQIVAFIRGDWVSPLLYFLGIVLMGSIFGLAFALENPKSYRWVYRPLMSVLSTLIFSFVTLWAFFAIKNPLKWR